MGSEGMGSGVSGVGVGVRRYGWWGQWSRV